VSMSGASRRMEMLGDVQHDILVMPRAPGLKVNILLVKTSIS